MNQVVLRASMPYLLLICYKTYMLLLLSLWAVQIRPHYDEEQDPRPRTTSFAVLWGSVAGLQDITTVATTEPRPTKEENGLKPGVPLTIQGDSGMRVNLFHDRRAPVDTFFKFSEKEKGHSTVMCKKRLHEKFNYQSEFHHCWIVPFLNPRGLLVRSKKIA